jgi:ATP-dependent RNA helicase DbpA
MDNHFEELKLKKELLENLKELNFLSMTPIQAKSLPLVLEGKDVIAQAKTGSGKTAAFGLSLLNNLDISNSRVQSLVLCPTRELADQVAKEIRTLARMLKNIKVLTLTGGKAEYFQEKSLAHGAHIIVGTPGRILKLASKEILELHHVQSLVLDEADRMLDMGFYDDMVQVSNLLPRDRQTLLFSATFPESIKKLGHELQNQAQEVTVDTELSENVIDESFYLLESHKNKPDALLRALSLKRPERFIVFCKTKQITDTVAKFLNEKDIYVEAIHGDLMQKERTAVLTMFSNQSLSGLIATDVAARGLDIQDLDMVINYDLPSDPEIYIHRVGRTARAGKTGKAITFCVPKEESKIEALGEIKKKKIELKELIQNEDEQKYDLLPPMETIYISGGKKDKLRPGDIVGAIIGEAQIDSKEVGDISITDIVSFVAIKSELVKKVINKLNNGKIKNRKFKVGLL